MSPQTAGPEASAAVVPAATPIPPVGYPTEPERSARRPGPPFSAWDLLGMLAGVALTLAITTVNTRGRIFWEDEMLGWLLLRDPSWRHMLHAWNLGADGGGFSFYLLGRGWFRLFGSSALAFRLFTSTCFGLAFATLWTALRRFFPIGIVAFATFNSLFFSPPLTLHYVEGRFYGLLVLSTALALWLALLLDAAPPRTPLRLYLAAFAVHALLTTSHVLGVLYSAALLAAIVVLDRLRGRRRIGLYLTVVATWLLLIPERTSIVAAGRVGKPHFWTKAPTPADILGAYTGFSHEILTVLVVLLLLAVLALVRAPGGWRPAARAEWERRLPLLVVAGCLLLVPVALLAEGFVGTWLFTDRYLQPVTLGIACLTAELACLALSLPLLHRTRDLFPRLALLTQAVASLVFAALTLYWVFHHVAMYTPEAPDFTEQLTTHLPHDVPVVVEDAFTFTGLLSTEARSGVAYTYVLDWPFSIALGAPRLEVTQFHLMENWKLAGYFPDHIEYIDSFLAEHPRFLVVHNSAIHPDPKDKPEIGNPLAERLSHNPAYTVQPYFILDRTYHDSVRDTVSLVCRGSCGNLPIPPQPNRCVLWSKGTTCCTGDPCAVPEPESPHGHHLWPFHKQ